MSWDAVYFLMYLSVILESEYWNSSCSDKAHNWHMQKMPWRSPCCFYSIPYIPTILLFWSQLEQPQPAESYLYFIWWKFFSHNNLFLALWGNPENQMKADSVSFQQKSFITKSIVFDAFWKLKELELVIVK